MSKLTSLAFSALLLLTAAFAGAQTAVLTPEPKIQFLNSIGVPLAGGCVQTYAAGTTTPQATFTDSSGSVSNTNPVILDSAGRASIFLSQGIQYKFVLTSFGGSNCATGTLQYTQDNIALGSTLTVGGSNTQVQYNSSGALAGSANFTWNNATQTLTIGALVTTSGGTLAGTFAGNPIFSGNPVFSGLPQFTGGGTMYGAWAGGPTLSIANSPSGATESGNTVTITTSSICPFVANQPVTIASVGVATYNGTWTVASGCSGGTTFTYLNPTFGLAASGGGTAIGAPLFSNALGISGGGRFDGTFGGNQNFSGLTSPKNLSGGRYADQFPGSDCGAKINAADADLSTTPGIIYVNQACGLTISTAVTLNAGHSLQFIQGGTWAQSALITMLDNASIIGLPAAINEDVLTLLDSPVVLQQPASINLAKMFLVKGQNIVFRNISIDGNRRAGGNNSTVCVLTDTSVTTANSRGRLRMLFATVENCGTDGLEITSDVSGNNQAIGAFIQDSSFSRNGANGITITRTTDTKIWRSSFELNAGYGVQSLDSPGFIFESDLSTNAAGQFFASYDATASGFTFMQNGWGLISNSITTTAVGSGMTDTANSSVIVNGYNGTSCGMGSESLIAFNSITVQSGLQDGVIDAIRLIDTNSDRVIGNAILSSSGGATRLKYGIDNTHDGSCASVFGTSVSGNTIVNNYTSGYYNLNTATDSEQNVLSTSTQSQRKRTAGCATAAAPNATCDTTVTWPLAFQDANYTVTCSGNVATSGVPMLEGVSISAAKTGAAVTVRTLAQTAAAAQFTNIECTAVHD